MTVCFFSAQYLPTVGGVERYTWNLAKRAAADGHHAIVVTSSLPDLPDHETDADGIEIFRLPVWAVMHGRFPVLKPSAEFSRLTRRLWVQPIDFCVVQTKMYVQSVWAARSARRRGIPFLVIDHSTGYMPMGGGIVGLCGRLYEQLACALIKGTDKHPTPFYGVSGAVCEWLKNGFRLSPVGCLPNAVDPKALQKLNQTCPKDWRKELNLSPDTRLIAYVGRLIPEKGAWELAQAVREIPNAALVIAGDGQLLEELRNLHLSNVYCPGNVPYPETVRLLCQADVYCLPTCYGEGFPTTLLEAAACRCAIVCTPTAGTDELLPDETYGVLLKDTSPETIREGLLRQLDSPAYRRTCTENTYRNLCEHFTWDAVYSRLLNIIENIL